MKNTLLALEQEAQNEETSPERLAELALMNDALAYFVAQNINTSPETLTQLGTSNNEEIIRAIARNPNTPTNIVIELGSKFPDELAENPILDLWLLEDIHPLLSSNKFSHLFAVKTKTPVSVLKILATHCNVYVRRKVASNLSTPVSLLEILATDSDKDVRSQVATNPNTPISLLEILATDSDKEVRYHVVSHQNTPISVLEILTKDSHSKVRNRASAKLEDIPTKPQSNE
ncbi:MAG: HEAT repeat domain-containing protein [Microcystaceae cyanobacterium]